MAIGVATVSISVVSQTTTAPFLVVFRCIGSNATDNTALLASLSPRAIATTLGADSFVPLSAASAPPPAPATAAVFSNTAIAVVVVLCLLLALALVGIFVVFRRASFEARREGYTPHSQRDMSSFRDSKPPRSSAISDIPDGSKPTEGAAGDDDLYRPLNA
jgi:hypothetical protein